MYSSPSFIAGLHSRNILQWVVLEKNMSMEHIGLVQGFLTCGEWRVARWGILCICFHQTQSCAVSPL